MVRGVALCVYLALLLIVSVLCQGRGISDLQEQAQEESEREGQGIEQDMVSINILNHHRVLESLLPPVYQSIARKSRSRRPSPPGPKRSPPGSRFALSLDVPTSILNVLIDLAKNHEMRAKAAANAELMARIGRRK